MRGTVSSWDGELLTVERTFSAGGQYDSLHVPKLAGDWGTIEVPRAAGCCAGPTSDETAR